MKLAGIKRYVSSHQISELAPRVRRQGSAALRVRIDREVVGVQVHRRIYRYGYISRAGSLILKVQYIMIFRADLLRIFCSFGVRLSGS